ncbi:hypothetical protein Bca4012_073079 [Brassica carinata]|uniref:Aquaporin n=1 Tax=Brassica carinata TaxID=52824 RepID=A0A8X7QND1_BRACI|nr:hypothetical protein Bca52824_065413 [Brassica carinata]
MYGKPVTLPGIAMVWGLTIMVMIYSIGQVSGAHFNPAVSIALASSRKFPFKQVGEIIMRDFQGMQQYLQEREDSRKLQQEGCTVEAYASFKKIMKGLQVLLKVELREVRRDKRRQGDAEDELVCSKQQEGSAQRKGYGLGPNRWSFVRSSVDTMKERSRQRSLSEAKAKSLGDRSLKHRLKHPGSASMASLGEIEVVWRRVLLSFTWCLVESGLTVCFCSGGFGVVLCVDVFRGSPVLVVWRVSCCWSKRVLLRLGFGQRVVYGFGSGLDRVLPSCSPPLMASPSLRSPGSQNLYMVSPLLPAWSFCLVRFSCLHVLITSSQHWNLAPRRCCVLMDVFFRRCGLLCSLCLLFGIRLDWLVGVLDLFIGYANFYRTQDLVFTAVHPFAASDLHRL